ncbi:hypothetical protein [Burkholderia gladioli]|uniref:hypothetical protein n=1 Tax=Burkholderia gladioli TaxID=28095 RepID=UPI00163E1D64|nr:hypothetical protein [Burkholderia gladioli]
MRFATNRSRCASARHRRGGRVPAQCGGAATEMAAAGTRTFWRIERRIDLDHRHRELADADLVIRKKASIPSRSRSLGRLEGAIRDDPDRDRPEAGRDPGGSPGGALHAGPFPRGHDGARETWREARAPAIDARAGSIDDGLLNSRAAFLPVEP